MARARHSRQCTNGHSSVTTTQRYTHMSVEDLRQQVADLPGNPAGGAP